MNPKPTGYFEETDAGADLVLKRTFRASLEDVWQSVTASESTARWFGSWTGEPGVGNTLELTMLFEKGHPKTNVEIRECDPPHHLAVSTHDDWGEWRLELDLTHADGITEMTFVHHLTDAKTAVDAGPGWDYYLDNLVASQREEPLPKFEDYYPSQKAYYADLIEQLGT